MDEFRLTLIFGLVFKYKLFSLELKRPGRESNHSPTPTAEFQSEWIYTNNCTITFMFRAIPSAVLELRYKPISDIICL